MLKLQFDGYITCTCQKTTESALFLIGLETIPEKLCSDWLKIRFDILPTGFGFLQLCLNER